jgi:hypothetical protein
LVQHSCCLILSVYLCLSLYRIRARTTPLRISTIDANRINIAMAHSKYPSHELSVFIEPVANLWLVVFTIHPPATCISTISVIPTSCSINNNNNKPTSRCCAMQWPTSDVPLARALIWLILFIGWLLSCHRIISSPSTISCNTYTKHLHPCACVCACVHVFASSSTMSGIPLPSVASGGSDSTLGRVGRVVSGRRIVWMIVALTCLLLVNYVYWGINTSSIDNMIAATGNTPPSSLLSLVGSRGIRFDLYNYGCVSC